MPFPINDAHWAQVRAFLEPRLERLTPLLAPNEFLEFFPGTYPYNVAYALTPERFAFVVLHKGRLDEIPPAFVLRVVASYTPVFANAVFVVYARIGLAPSPRVPDVHLQPLLTRASALAAAQRGHERALGYAALITTYNRPRSLARTLPQVVALGAQTLIVDDGSTDENARENQRHADDHGVPLLRVPRYRGLCNATNTGITYWLADRGIDWISYFQDDVDVHPELLQVLARIQHPVERPLLAGLDAPEHPTVATGAISGYPVLYKRSMPGLHLHAHRDYWESVLPIPMPYLGAPKPVGGRPGQGSDEDWWITAWSPNAIAKRGGYVVCVPGLVRTFEVRGEGSTWTSVSGRGQAADAVLEALAVRRTDGTAVWVPASPAVPRFDPENRD
jgi:hypothetical protein